MWYWSGQGQAEHDPTSSVLRVKWPSRLRTIYGCTAVLVPNVLYLYHVPQTQKGLVVAIALFRSLDCPGTLARSRQGRYLSLTEMSPAGCSVQCSARSPLFMPLCTSCRSQSIVLGFGIKIWRLYSQYNLNSAAGNHCRTVSGTILSRNDGVPPQHHHAGLDSQRGCRYCCGTEYFVLPRELLC